VTLYRQCLVYRHVELWRLLVKSINRFAGIRMLRITLTIRYDVDVYCQCASRSQVEVFVSGSCTTRSCNLSRCALALHLMLSVLECIKKTLNEQVVDSVQQCELLQTCCIRAQSQASMSFQTSSCSWHGTMASFECSLDLERAKRLETPSR
jgi:hypothetical protein